GVLQVAAGALDDVSVTDAINLLNVGTLTIFVAGAISNTTGGSLAVQSGAGGLSLIAGNDVSLTGANSVSTLSATVANGGKVLTFNNAGALVIGTVDAVAGISTNGGDVTVSTTNGNLTVDKNVAAGPGPINLTAGCNPGTDNLLTNNAALTG